MKYMSKLRVMFLLREKSVMSHLKVIIPARVELYDILVITYKRVGILNKRYLGVLDVGAVSWDA